MMNITKRYTAYDIIIHGTIEGEEFCVSLPTADYTDEEVAREFSELVGVLSTDDVLQKI